MVGLKRRMVEYSVYRAHTCACCKRRQRQIHEQQRANDYDHYMRYRSDWRVRRRRDGCRFGRVREVLIVLGTAVRAACAAPLVDGTAVGYKIILNLVIRVISRTYFGLCTNVM